MNTLHYTLKSIFYYTMHAYMEKNGPKQPFKLIKFKVMCLNLKKSPNLSFPLNKISVLFLTEISAKTEITSLAGNETGISIQV